MSEVVVEMLKFAAVICGVNAVIVGAIIFAAYRWGEK